MYFTSDTESDGNEEVKRSIVDSPLGKEIEEKLEMHDQAIRIHRAKIEQNKQWFRTQLETPNFSTNDLVSTINSSTLKKSTSNLSSLSEDERKVSRSKSKSPSNRKRDKPIEELLQEYGKKYSTHKDLMREEHLEKIRQNESFAPSISEFASSLSRDYGKKIEERLVELEKERQDKLDELREQRKEQEYPYKPKISAQSKELQGRSDVINVNKNWAQVRERKLESMRKEKDFNDSREISLKPSLGSKTLKIVSKLKDRNEKRKDVPFEEYLERQEVDRQQRLAEKQEIHMRAISPGTPRITSQAAQLVREGSVTDRLYEMSYDINKKKQEWMDKKKLIEESYAYSPRVSASVKYNTPRNLPVHDDLFQRDEKIRQKNMEKLQQLLEKEKELHHPKINPVSEVIAANLPSTSKERLLGLTSAHIFDADDVARFNEHSFKPEINSKSRTIEEHKGTAGNLEVRIHNMLQREKKKQDNLKILRDFYDQKEMEECTFTPRLYTQFNDDMTFSERMERWDKKRKEKIAKERNTNSSKELENCTFKPSVNRNANDPAGDPPLGYEEWVQRQKQARQQKEENSKGIFCTGDKWTNKPTVPKEFVFGKSRHVKVKSLQKPLSPGGVAKKPPIGFIQIINSIHDDEEDDEDDQNNLSKDHDKSQDRTPDIDTDAIPPQGLFSNFSTFSILEGIQYKYNNSEDHLDVNTTSNQDGSFDQTAIED